MDILISNFQNLSAQVDGKFFRYLFDKIDWNQRMIAIKGPRGSGKTTLMLQRIKFGIKPKSNEALYFSADHYWFYTHNLVETAHTFYQNGGRFLFIDEVHKYPNWSRELKNIYDSYPDLKVVFSSSSALDIYRGESDLSRRVITYELPGMSFREYLNLTHNQNFQPVSLAEIQNTHSQITSEITSRLQPLPVFKEYLKRGYLPIITESNPKTIPIFLQQIINTVVESDLAFIADYNAGTAYKVKKLLGVLAESVPFKPNVSSIARKVETSRDSVYEWLTQLEKARLLNFLIAEGKGISQLQKPDKVYLENANLSYALKANPEIGSIRETFLLNQLKNLKKEIRLPKSGDFQVDDLVIEVGGKNKDASQINHLKNYLVAADEIEHGFGKKVPLWLFGMMY
ncbi:putative AAA+ superfamily ATPase [Algoriphagus sp. 4150]|uniref:ATP-binding protein n=1 Tax=Algoriphagus sp. 4150 TaxID=2817756 RepID=UPI0028626F7B|nr:AAA family ATPase [Algoriphagus sp. 4150]MDR7131390.1 putative AAA+ superfamily ATPase [Algoriphagus sp. 4150]